MKNWLINITTFGTDSVQDDGLKRRIIFSNIIFLTLPVVYVFLMLLDFKTFFSSNITLAFDQFIVPIIVVVCLLCLTLNKYHFTSLSRITFLMLWPLFLQFIPIILQKTPADYYLAYPMGLIFHAILIQISFSQKKEPVKFWGALTVSFLLMIFSLDFLTAFDELPPEANAVRTNAYYRLDGIMYWMLFNLLIFYLMLVIENSIEKKSKANTLIEEQKEALAEKNEELQQAIISLQDLNNYVEVLNKELEEKVRLRTSELEIKNQKLVEYASYNAHQLRGPFCRIKGLVYLQEENISNEEILNIKKMLCHSLNEMDEVIAHIQKTVSTERIQGHEDMETKQKS